MQRHEIWPALAAGSDSCAFALLTLEAATFANNAPFDVDAAGNGYAFVGAQTRTCTAGGCE